MPVLLIQFATAANSSKFHIFSLYFFFSKQKWDVELNLACVYEDMAACLTNAPCWKLHEVIPIALVKPRCQKVPLHAEKRALCQLKI